MLKKISILLSFLLLFSLASVGADTLIKTLVVTTQPTDIYIDGVLAKEKTPGMYHNGTKEVPLALLYEGTNYVPLRYISEKLGKEVGWESKTKSIWVGKKPAQFSTAPDTSIATPAKYNIASIYIGQTDQDVTKLLGKPNRIDPNYQGYEWWIYNSDLSSYIQVGIKDRKVVDVYTNSSKYSLPNGLMIGSSKSQLQKQVAISSTVNLAFSEANFTLTNDLAERNLVLLDGVPFIFYLDVHDKDKITAARSLSIENLVKLKLYPYKYTYYKKPDLSSPTLSAKERKQIELAEEKQVFDLANTARTRHGLPTFTWNDEAAAVALTHSIDMLDNGFFDHDSPTTGSLVDRMNKYGVRYMRVGENIAYNYSNAIEAHEGWMNSLGHRNNLLNQHFKTLGVGIEGYTILKIS